MKIRTDSLEQAMYYKDQYLLNIKRVLQGEEPVALDTTLLNIPVTETTTD